MSHELESLFDRALNRPETLSETERRRVLDAVAAGTELNVVHTLSSLAEHDQGTIDEIVDRLQPQLRADEDRNRGEAVLVFATLARRYPGRLTSVAPDAVALLTDDYPTARNRAAQLLARLAGVDPDLAVPAAPYVRPFVRSDAPILRLSGLEIVHAIARTAPDRITGLVIDLVDVVAERSSENDAVEKPPRRRGVRMSRRVDNTEWQREQARARAAQTLAIVASECPAALSGSIPRLAAVIECDDHPIVVGALADGIAALAGKREVVEAIDPLGTALDRFEDDESLARIALALSSLANRHGEAVTESVRPVLPTVIALLEAEAVRGAATALLVVVSECRPDAVEPALGAIRGLLDDPDPVVRQGAVWVLGAAGRPGDRDRLSTLREEDPDEDVRKAAPRALGEIEARYNGST